MLANELGRRGVRCLLVDPKNGTTTLTPQANATQARTMEHYRRLGFASEIRAQGLPPDHPTDIAYFTRYTVHELARLPLPTAAQAVKNIQHMTARGAQPSCRTASRRNTWRQRCASTPNHCQLPMCVTAGLWKVLKTAAAMCWRRCGKTVSPSPEREGRLYLVGVDGPRSLVRNRLASPGHASGIKREFMGGKMFAVHFQGTGVLRGSQKPACVDVCVCQFPAPRFHGFCGWQIRVRLSCGGA